MGMEVDPENPLKAVLRPRHPGESLKVAKTVLKRRDENLKVRAQQAVQIAKIRKEQKKKLKPDLGIVRVEKLIKNAICTNWESQRVKAQKKKKKPKVQKGKVVMAVRNGRAGATCTKQVKQTLKGMRL